MDPASLIIKIGMVLAVVAGLGVVAKIVNDLFPGLLKKLGETKPKNNMKVEYQKSNVMTIPIKNALDVKLAIKILRGKFPNKKNRDFERGFNVALDSLEEMISE